MNGDNIAWIANALPEPFVSMLPGIGLRKWLVYKCSDAVVVASASFSKRTS